MAMLGTSSDSFCSLCHGPSNGTGKPDTETCKWQALDSSEEDTHTDALTFPGRLVVLWTQRTEESLETLVKQDSCLRREYGRASTVGILWFPSDDSSKVFAWFLETTASLLYAILTQCSAERTAEAKTLPRTPEGLTFLSSSFTIASRTTLWCANTRNFSRPLSKRSRIYSLYLTMITK